MVFNNIRTKIQHQAAEKDEFIVGLDVGTEFVEALVASVEGDKKFKVIKEEVCSAGVRRIKAVLA